MHLGYALYHRQVEFLEEDHEFLLEIEALGEGPDGEQGADVAAGVFGGELLGDGGPEDVLD